MKPAAALVVAIALAQPLLAGPCTDCEPSSPDRVGWWDDRALQPGQLADRGPRIDVDGDGVRSRAAIAWERSGAADGDAWVAVSDDGGCSWAAVPVATGPEDDGWPDVAVARALDVVVVALVRDGFVHVAVSGDGGRTFAAPAPVDLVAPADAASRPRLAAIAVGSGLHVHVAWAEGGRIRLATSLAGGAAGTWSGGPALSSRFAGFGGWTEVDVAADTRSRRPGTDSAVTLLVTGLAAGSVASEVFSLRSNDSGATFFGDPAQPATQDVPQRVTDARPASDPAAGAGGASLDVSDDGSGEFYSWQGALVTDPVAPAGARFDARAEEGAGPSVMADWNDGAPGDLPVGAGTRAAGVSIVPNPLQRPPQPETHLFVEVAPAGREIASVRGWLDVNVAERFVETCPLTLLTGESPPRVAGEVEARSFSADEDLSHVFVAWADSRDGGSSIWWKRTDSVVAPVTNVVVAPGDCATGGGLLVSWRPAPSPPQCDVARVRVDWRRPAGLTEGSVDVVGRDSVQLTGLAPSTDWLVRVTVIDEACNAASAPEAAGTSAACSPVSCPLPVGPSLRASRQPTRGDVRLTWDPPPTDASHDAATSYDIHRSTDLPSSGFSLVANGTATEWVDAGAAAAGQAPRHFYRVIARNACGTSGDEPP